MTNTIARAKRQRHGGAVEVLLSGRQWPSVLLQAREALEAGDIQKVSALLNGSSIKSLQAELIEQPDQADMSFFLGWLFFQIKQPDQAEYWYRHAIKYQPHALALQQLGRLCRLTGRYGEATALRKRALDLEPDNVELVISVALDLMREGKLEQGIHWLRRAVTQDPTHADAHSKLLFHLHYLPDQDRASLFQEHKQWGRRHAPSDRARISHPNDPNPDRKLRIGYLSADFRRHSVAYSWEPLLDGHDRDHFEIFGYGHVAQPDPVTDRLASKCDVYRDIWDKEDTEVVRLIEQDKIDILVALAGHTRHHRLAVLAYRPAPIQADFQGINTTGMEQVDYRFTDDLLDPPGSESFYVERSITLPEGLHCYAPPAWAPDVGPLPALDNGYITFGSFNNGMKINEKVIALWIRVLQANPTSHLLIKCPGGNDPKIQQRFLHPLAQAGMTRDRIRICGRVSVEEHFRMYHEIDIALDSFPFNGCMTTMEGLWMGVPIITRVGPYYVSREGLSLLHQVGLDIFATTTDRDYVAKATALAHNREALARIRASLRGCMRISPLCNAKTYTQHVEKALRDIWQRWCVRQAGKESTPMIKTAPSQQASQSVSDEHVIHFSISKNSDLHYSVSQDQLPTRLLEAVCAAEAGRIQEAQALLDEQTVNAAAAIYHHDSARMDILFLLGMLFSRTEQPDQAAYWFQQLIEVKPHALAYFELGHICRHTGRLSEALTYHQKALTLSPDSPELQTTLADDYIAIGQSSQGIDMLRQVVACAPDRTNHSKYLWHLHQNPEFDQHMLFTEHQHWAHLYADTSLARGSHDRDRNPERRLRIGYISPDFCSHSVAYFFESLLEQHHADQVETFGYGQVVYQDQVTDRIREKFNHYQNICCLDDSAVVEMIERDKIDILVDLAGHTGDNRLGVLAYKPAPIQVSFLGYPDTTGMEQIDYRFTDRWADTSDTQCYHTETLIFLEKGFICYRPPEFAPPIGPLPAKQNGFITYGSFNNNCKINTHTLKLWSQILKKDPTACLLLKFNGGDDPNVKQHYLDQFSHYGVDPARIRIVGRVSVVEHLQMYHQVDIALDTYPYHGTTTTCEALWMGVPSISLIGPCHAGRVGLSLLSRVGLEAFCASTPLEYTGKALAYAKELENLASIRRSLRSLMINSDLCDAQGYTRTVETAYRSIWRQWCQGDKTDPENHVQEALINKDHIPVSHNKSGILSRCVIFQGQTVELKVPQGSLSPCLLQAYTAVEAGRIHEALALIESDVDVIHTLRQGDSEYDCLVAFVLGHVYQKAGHLEKAREFYEEIITHESHSLVLNKLADVYEATGRYKQAREMHKCAHAQDPQDIWTRYAIAKDHFAVGELEQGITCLQALVQEGPPIASIHSSMLFFLHYHPQFNQHQLLHAHKQWARRFASQEGIGLFHTHDPTPDRRLRIGYITPDFRDHPVACFLEPLLKGHNPDQVEVYGYGNVPVPDGVTDRLSGLCDHYRTIRSMSDDDVVDIIRMDGIDILVDLAGHTSDNRLGVLARKPAPIQVSGLGYCDTTGLEQIDYRLTDPWADLATSQRYHTEQLVMLEKGFNCYQAPDETPAVGPLPAERNGYVTFGSFNCFCKMNTQVIAMWSRILASLPDAHLLLKFSHGDDPCVQQHFLEQFRTHDIDPERIRIWDRLPVPAHFDMYNQVDIALDTYPYNGTTTTCEAMWMGVPTVTLVGSHHASRVGLSLLSRVGLDVFTATTPDAYVEKAVSFAQDTEYLKEIRGSLRSIMLQSSLCDSKIYASQMENAYRSMWYQWCGLKEVKRPGCRILKRDASSDERIVLHVGCGDHRLNFSSDNWHELCVDIDPRTCPDILNSITDMKDVEDTSVHVIWCSHNLEHLYAHEVEEALSEFHRVLKPGGKVYILVPDVQTVAEHISQGKLEEPLYQSSAGPVSAIDLLWGYHVALKEGNTHMAHKIGFTADTLYQKLRQAGFRKVKVDRCQERFELQAEACK